MPKSKPKLRRNWARRNLPRFLKRVEKKNKKAIRHISWLGVENNVRKFIESSGERLGRQLYTLRQRRQQAQTRGNQGVVKYLDARIEDTRNAFLSGLPQKLQAKILRFAEYFEAKIPKDLDLQQQAEARSARILASQERSRAYHARLENAQHVREAAATQRREAKATRFIRRYRVLSFRRRRFTLTQIAETLNVSINTVRKDLTAVGAPPGETRPSKLPALDSLVPPSGVRFIRQNGRPPRVVVDHVRLPATSRVSKDWDARNLTPKVTKKASKKPVAGKKTTKKKATRKKTVKKKIVRKKIEKRSERKRVRIAAVKKPVVVPKPVLEVRPMSRTSQLAAQRRGWVLQLLKEGKSNAEIAAELGIAEGTVGKSAQEARSKKPVIRPTKDEIVDRFLSRIADVPRGELVGTDFFKPKEVDEEAVLRHAVGGRDTEWGRKRAALTRIVLARPTKSGRLSELFKAALPGSEFNDRMDVMDTAIELLDIGVFEELAPGYLQIDTYWHIRKKK